jgi:imidazoleglycerol phosphate dehydratase HisB
MTPTARTAEVTRNTAETRITVRVNLDGTGQARLSTGIGFFDHMLDQIARHGLIDLDIQAEGDLHIDGHHTVEDVGITLGQAVAKAVGDKKGIRRYGHAYVPLDEALSRVVIDFSGRPGLVMHVPFKSGMIGTFDSQLARVLPGLRQPRLRDPAHRQPARRKRPPPGRNRVQGLCPGPARRAGAGSALGGHDSVHEGFVVA